jgi:hypothetical protein
MRREEDGAPEVESRGLCVTIRLPACSKISLV